MTTGVDWRLQWPARIAAVSAADVYAVARRYLDPRSLRAVLSGNPKLLPDAKSMDFGDPVRTDAFGHTFTAKR
jgi:hypothetical protein